MPHCLTFISHELMSSVILVRKNCTHGQRSQTDTHRDPKSFTGHCLRQSAPGELPALPSASPLPQKPQASARLSRVHSMNCLVSKVLNLKFYLLYSQQTTSPGAPISTYSSVGPKVRHTETFAAPQRKVGTPFTALSKRCWMTGAVSELKTCPVNKRGKAKPK